MMRWWQGRSTRERTVLATGAGAAALLLFVAFVWIPLERTRTRLAAEVPALRASIARLEQDAAEVQRLRAMPARPASAATSALGALDTSAVAGAHLVVLDERRVRLTAGDVSFAALLEWLASAQAAQGLHVESARIEALPLAGRVRAELTLARS